MLRGLVAMTKRGFSPDFVTRLGNALRRALKSHGQKRDNEESDLKLKVTRPHSPVCRVANDLSTDNNLPV